MPSISLHSHVIKDKGTGCTFKDIQSVLEHLRHSESIWALEQSEGTQMALKGHLGT